MRKIFPIVLMISLLIPSIVNAKFSDEYRAKYPRRVKVTTSLQPSGKKLTTVVYTLFKHTLINGRPLQLIVRDRDGIKICSISYGDTTSHPAHYEAFTWGDGEHEHNLKTFLSFTDRAGHGRYSHFITTQPTGADLENMKDAVVFSVTGGGSISTPILDKSHKRWDEWQEAVDAAAKIMNERYIADGMI